MKIYLQHDPSCQSWFRVFQPYCNCGPYLAQDNIQLYTKDILPHYLNEYDAYVFQRKPSVQNFAFIQEVKRQGKKLVWALDDDVYHIPSWSPVAQAYADTTSIDWLRTNADYIWVSTEYMKDKIFSGDNVRVLPNLIDLKLWKGHEETRPVNSELRILWSGSGYHDLEGLVPIVDYVLEKHKDVMFIFFGNCPTNCSEVMRIAGSMQAKLLPGNKYKGKLGYVEPVDINSYASTLSALNPDIGICWTPEEEEFNHAKSNLKWLDYSMVGAATVASNVAAYKDIIGLNSGNILDDIETLIGNEVLRKTLGVSAKEEVLAKWTWAGPQKPKWIEAFRELAGYFKRDT